MERTRDRPGSARASRRRGMNPVSPVELGERAGRTAVSARAQLRSLCEAGCHPTRTQACPNTQMRRSRLGWLQIAMLCGTIHVQHAIKVRTFHILCTCGLLWLGAACQPGSPPTATLPTASAEPATQLPTDAPV